MRKLIVAFLLLGLTVAQAELHASSRKPGQKVRQVDYYDGDDVLYEDEADYEPCDDYAPSVRCKEDKQAPRVFWGSVDFLYWWTKNSTAPGPIAVNGTSTAIDPSSLDLNGAAGANFAFGINHPTGMFGWEIGGFFLGDRSQTAGAASNATGSPALARPFTTTGGAPASLPVSMPGMLRGDVGALSTSSLWGMDTNISLHPASWAWGDPDIGMGLFGDLLFGFRYLDLDEVFAIGQTSTLLNGSTTFAGSAISSPTTLRIVDVFDTTNRFYGPQIASRFEFAWGRCYLNALGKLAFGVTHQTVGIHGSSTAFTPTAATITGPGSPASSYAGGLYALPSNTGVTSNNAFSVVPEIALTFGYNATENLRFYFGYNLLYWSNVVRSADQIDTTVNPAQIPVGPSFGPLTGPARPAANFNTSDFWAQGFLLGFAYRF